MNAPDIEALIVELGRSAQLHSDADKMFADAKSARQGDPGSCYDYLRPEQTVEGRAAAILTTLLAEREAMRKALEPFALGAEASEVNCKRLDCGQPGDETVIVLGITYGHLRAARTAYKGAE